MLEFPADDAAGTGSGPDHLPRALNEDATPRLRWPAVLDRPLVHALLAGIGVSAAVVALSFVGGIAGWETKAVDSFMVLRDRIPSPDLIVVTIDRDAFLENGGRQPFSRRYLADLGDILLRSGARVVGFDFVLTTPSVTDEDDALVAMTKRWSGAGPPRIVFASELRRAPGSSDGRRSVEAPPYASDLHVLLGFEDAPEATDGVVRQLFPVLPDASGAWLPSFGLAVLGAIEGYTPDALKRALAGQATLSLPVLDREHQSIRGSDPLPVSRLRAFDWRIDFTGPPGTFQTFPSTPLVREARAGTFAPARNAFAGKIVLVGAGYPESRDIHPTPVGRMTGVELQANIVHTLLARRGLLPPPWWLNVALLLAVSLAVAVLAVYVRPLVVTAVSVAGITVLAAGSLEAYRRGYWLDAALPIAAIKLYGRYSAFRERRHVEAAFAQFVSPDVLRRVARHGSEPGGEVRSVTVLMADFGAPDDLAAKRSPAVIADRLDACLASMVDVVVERNGYVSDVSGERLLCVFGAPLPDADHAWGAVQCAIQLRSAIARVNAAHSGPGEAAVPLRVLIDTGEAFVGIVGSSHRRKYCVLGGPMTTVAAMAPAAEAGTVLVTAATGAAVEGRIVLRRREPSVVMAGGHSVDVFEVVSAGTAAPAQVDV